MSKKESKNKSSVSEVSDTSESVAVKVYKYKEIKFKNTDVSELNKSGAQPMAFINYNDPVLQTKNKILVQSGHIKMTSGGIPPLDKDNPNQKGYYPNNSKREFIKIPLDPEQDACIELRKHLEEADKWAGSEELRKKLFGNKYKKYVYTPCIKSPKYEDENEDENDDYNTKNKKGNKDKNKIVTGKDGREYRVRVGKDGKEYIIMDFVKMKFNILINKNPKIKSKKSKSDEDDDDDQEERIIKTKIKKVLGKNNKKIIEVKSISDIAKEIKYQSEIRFIFYYNKIWANKSPSQGTDIYPYGLGLKIMSIEYTPSKGAINTDNVEFRSDDEDDNNDNIKETKKMPTKKSAKLDDDDENDNESDEKDDIDPDDNNKSKEKSKEKTKNINDDDDEINDKKTSKNKTKEKSKKSEEEDSNEDEEDHSSKKKQSKKKKAKVEDEDEQDEDEQDEDENEDEDEQDEEETKSKKKSSKGKSASRSK